MREYLAEKRIAPSTALAGPSRGRPSFFVQPYQRLSPLRLTVSREPGLSLRGYERTRSFSQTDFQTVPSYPIMYAPWGHLAGVSLSLLHRLYK